MARSRVWRIFPVLSLIFVLVPPRAAVPQGRELKKIPRPPKVNEAMPLSAEQLPGSAQCEAAVRRVARAWGSAEDLDPLLMPEFPNRSQFLDATRRARLQATNIELEVEAIVGTHFTPPEVVSTDEGERIVTDCIAEVTSRVIFDDPETGERITRDPGHAQWRIRFSRATGGAR